MVDAIPLSTSAAACWPAEFGGTPTPTTMTSAGSTVRRPVERSELLVRSSDLGAEPEVDAVLTVQVGEHLATSVTEHA